MAVSVLAFGLVLAPSVSASAATSTPTPSATTTKKKKATPKPLPGAEKKPQASECLTLAKFDKKAIPTAEEQRTWNWPGERLQYAQAWQLTRGKGVVVAVVDSGVDAQHPQLRGRVRTGVDVTSGKVAKGANTDCLGHGTSVAGIIAAAPREGVAMTGMAPEAVIFPVRVTWGFNKDGEVKTANFIRALDEAVQQSGVRVVNVSVTVPVASLRPAERKRFESIVTAAEARGVLIVAASGNVSSTGPYAGQQVENYPAALATTHRNVIAVTGLAPDGKIAPEAITGPWVTVAAPGSNLLAPMRGTDTLVYRVGTSFATPYVSGLAALLVAHSPELTPSQIRQAIEMTAEHPSTNPSRSTTGYGMVNPPSALTAELPSAVPESTPRAAAPLTPSTPPDDLARTLSLALAGVAVAFAVLLPVGAVVVRLGRARRWRPGRLPG
ncbi:MAG: S8 family serine peptidase [Kineosporiaceae bacterium]